jgi:hypothetical protein
MCGRALWCPSKWKIVQSVCVGNTIDLCVFTMAALTLTDIPSFAYTFAGFLSGEDVLTLRHVSSRVKSLVDEESEHIFDMLLGRDFGLLSADLRRSALRILPEQNGPSVFGTRANDAIIKCSSAFECWLGWKRASWRYDPRPSHHYIWAPCE